jgi:hypothetical protein
MKAKDRAQTAASFARPLRAAVIDERLPETAPIVSNPAIAEPARAAEPEAAAAVIGATLSRAWSEPSLTREKKKSGAPRRLDAYVRRTFTVNQDLSAYVDRAWRRYPTQDGTYAKGVSGFIETLISEHRDRNGG